MKRRRGKIKQIQQLLPYTKHNQNLTNLKKQSCLIKIIK